MSPRKDPGRDGPDEQEPLEELIGTIFELADEVASGISPEEVEARLRRTLREAVDQEPVQTSPGESVRPEVKTPKVVGTRGGIEPEQSRREKIQRKSPQPNPVTYPPLVAAAGGYVPMASPEDSDWNIPPSIFGTRAGGPTVQRMVLGTQLHRLRVSRGISMVQAAEAIRASHAKIGRVERGRVGLKQRDVADLLTLYGVTDKEERAALLNLAETASTPGWWHSYSDIVLTRLEPYIALEAVASIIQTYQNQLIPGILQTEEYARTLLRQEPAATEDEIVWQGELRASQQEALRRSDPPQLWFVIDEVALRRRIGTEEVIREQLRHLMEVSDHPAVTLQILPFSAGARLATTGPFTILHFAEPDVPTVVYIEHLTNALYVDKPVEVDRYIEVMDRLCLRAEPESKTKKLLGQILSDI